MAANPSRGKATPVSDLVTQILDPVMRRRAGMSLALIQSWEEIAGEALAQNSRPERIAWPRRANEDDPFQPATLVIACEAAAALRLQHMTGEIIARVNAFLGFGAVAKVRLVQKQVSRPESRRRPEPRPLRRDEAARLETKVAGIEDDALRQALERLGRSVLSSRG